MPENKGEVKDKVNEAFDAIEALRKKADDALTDAKKQTNLALEATKYAEKQQSIAEAASKEATEQKDKAESSNKKLQEFLSTVIGAKYKGGKIAWKDSTGKHGLIAAEMDMPGGMIYTWDSAMAVCNKYFVKEGDSTYGGWRLPTKEELNKLYVNKDVVGGFINDYYWSSSEHEEARYDAWYHNFNNGLRYGSSGVSKFRVRAVRAY
jgi:hypothetical protein